MKVTFSLPVKFYTTDKLQFMIATFKDGNIAIRKADIFVSGKPYYGG
jgi:hypothetical protein